MLKYIVGLTVVHERRNILIKVSANNDYYAVIGALRRFNASLGDAYPEKREFISKSWEAEKERLLSHCKDYNSLHNYLCLIGLIVSKPMLLEAKKT